MIRRFKRRLLVLTSPAVFIVHTQRRSIVEKRNDRSFLQGIRNRMEGLEVKKRSHGNVYRLQEKLWDSTESLERDMTMKLIEPPHRAPPKTGRSTAATALLEASDAGEEARLREVGLLLEEGRKGEGYAELTLVEDSQSNKHNQLTTTATAAIAKLREDYSSNALAPSCSWDALSLDPLLANLARRVIGPNPTRLQSRMIPELLHEDHSDLILSSVTGSGKTAALVLAALHAVRTENAGINVIVAASSILAQRCVDMIHAICRPVGGSFFADRDVFRSEEEEKGSKEKKDEKSYNDGDDDDDDDDDEMSWVVCGQFREEAHKYFHKLRRSATDPAGPARILVTTPDVLCDLMFTYKLEYAQFGYMRRLFVDDVVSQLYIGRREEYADKHLLGFPHHLTYQEMKERFANPTAIEMLLATCHQIPAPEVRSVMQIACVDSGMDTTQKNHLKQLCIKPTAHKVLLSVARLPSTIQCLFLFHLFSQSRFSFLVDFLRACYPTIPGRAIIFVEKGRSLLDAQHDLRKLGVAAAILGADVVAEELSHATTMGEDGGEQQEQQQQQRRFSHKFILIHEGDACGYHIPLVSHVFITFPPQSRHSYMQMCGRTGRLGNVGWVYVVCDRAEAKHVKDVASELDVDVTKSTVDPQTLQLVKASDVAGWVKDAPLTPMDPQYAVLRNYEDAENPTIMQNREFWFRPVNKQFLREDYTPLSTLYLRYRNARKFEKDFIQTPSMSFTMQRRGLLNKYMRPTQKLRRMLEQRD